MAIYGEYTTVAEVRQTYLGISGTTDDALLLTLIRAVSCDIERACGGRWFYPRVITRTYNVPSDRLLRLDGDLLSVIALINGDGNNIAATEYVLHTPNTSPKWGIELKPGSHVSWQYSASGERLQVIQVTGVWGHDLDGRNEWRSVDTLATALNNLATTLVTSTSGSIQAGWLLQIDDEYIYASVVNGTTVTVVRGVNGTTATVHNAGADIRYWHIDYDLQLLCSEVVAMRYRQRENPGTETMSLPDGTVIPIPRDTYAYLEQRLGKMGLRPL